MLPWLEYRKDDYDDNARRGEDPPTRFDGAIRLCAAAGQIFLACVCFLTWWLFLRDMQTPAKPVAAAIFLAVGVGFVIQSVRNIGRGVQILRTPR